MTYGDSSPPPGWGPNGPSGPPPGVPGQPPPGVPGQPPPGAGYPYGYQYRPPQKPIEPLAIVSIVLSGLSVFCCGFAGLLGLPGLICGVIAYRQVADDPEANPTSKTLAIIGMALGGVVVLISGVIMVFSFVLPLLVGDPAAFALP